MRLCEARGCLDVAIAHRRVKRGRGIDYVEVCREHDRQLRDAGLLVEEEPICKPGLHVAARTAEVAPPRVRSKKEHTDRPPRAPRPRAPRAAVSHGAPPGPALDGDPVCIVDGCGREARRRGLCDRHYVAHHKRGDLDVVALPPTPRALRTRRRRKRRPPFDCSQ